MDKFRKVSEMVQFAPDKMKKNSLFETPRFFCDVYGFEPGQAQAAHSHEGSDKVYYVIQGRGTFEIGEEKKELGAGEIAIAESGVKHGVTNHGKERLVLLVYMAPKPAH